MYHCTPGTVDCFPVLSIVTHLVYFSACIAFHIFSPSHTNRHKHFIWFICPSITWCCYGTVQNNLFHTIISAIQNSHHAQFWHNSEMSKLHQTTVGGKRPPPKKKMVEKVQHCQLVKDFTVIELKNKKRRKNRAGFIFSAQLIRLDQRLKNRRRPCWSHLTALSCWDIFSLNQKHLHTQAVCMMLCTRKGIIYEGWKSHANEEEAVWLILCKDHTASLDPLEPHWCLITRPVRCGWAKTFLLSFSFSMCGE